jgi:hypothetical protein
MPRTSRLPNYNGGQDCYHVVNFKPGILVLTQIDQTIFIILQVTKPTLK